MALPGRERPGAYHRDIVKVVAAAAASFVTLVLLLGAGIYSTAVVAPFTSTPAPAPGVEAASEDDAAAAPFVGASTGCSEPDPTNPAGCLTPATAWLYVQLQQHFGQQPTACWDRHAWNPSSDHPRGRACDVTIGTAGTFPDDADRAHGWEVADWLRTNAGALDISYVIWDGKIWSVSRDVQGWRRYDGGGVYDVSSPTGGHFDHVHVSTSQ